MSRNPLSLRRKQYIIAVIMTTMVNVLPLLFFVAKSFFDGTIRSEEKLILGTTVVVCFVLSAIAFVTKCALKARIWIVILGVYFCLSNFETVILTISITQILDELIFAPIAHRARDKYRIAKEINFHAQADQ